MSQQNDSGEYAQFGGGGYSIHPGLRSGLQPTQPLYPQPSQGFSGQGAQNLQVFGNKRSDVQDVSQLSVAIPPPLSAQSSASQASFNEASYTASFALGHAISQHADHPHLSLTSVPVNKHAPLPPPRPSPPSAIPTQSSQTHQMRISALPTCSRFSNYVHGVAGRSESSQKEPEGLAGTLTLAHKLARDLATSFGFDSESGSEALRGSLTQSFKAVCEAGQVVVINEFLKRLSTYIGACNQVMLLGTQEEGAKAKAQLILNGQRLVDMFDNLNTPVPGQFFHLLPNTWLADTMSSMTFLRMLPSSHPTIAFIRPFPQDVDEFCKGLVEQDKMLLCYGQRKIYFVFLASDPPEWATAVLGITDGYGLHVLQGLAVTAVNSWSDIGIH